MLLSSTIMMFAAMAFTSCVDDNDDLGMPYLEVTPEVLKFDADGKAIGASEFEIKTNRVWTLDIPEGAEWVRPSATSGNGDGKVSFNLFASAVGQSAKLTFSLKNSAGFAYMTRDVIIEQGDAPQVGPIGELVAWIKEKNPAAGALNYPVETIEAVILANNVYGNNFGKLYVGDNTTLPNSGMILYSTTDYNKPNSAKFPVGKKVTLDMRNAEYAPYQNLRELKGVVVTVSDEDPVTVVYPTLSAAQLNTDEYQGQYVKVTNVTPQSSFVGQAWVTSDKRAVKLDANGGAEVQSYMTTASDAPDFATMTIANKTGAIYGAAERIGTTIQIIPTKPEDVMEISEGGDEPAVSTGAASTLTATEATLAGSSRNIADATEVGVEYILFADAIDWSGATKKAAAAVSTSWTVEVTGLTESTKYAYRAYAVSSGSTIYGAAADFTTKSTSSADIFVDFTDLGGYPSGFPDKKGTTTLATYNFGGYDFTFFGVMNSDKGGYYSSTYSTNVPPTVLIWGQKGGYIGLPAVSDKALTKVVCTVPEGASGAVQVGVYDAANQPVSGGEAITWEKSGSGYRTYTYTLSGTAVNTSYRLYVNNAYNSQLAQLELYYGEGGGAETPSLTPATATMEFASAADAVGKTQEYTLANASGLTLFAEVADKTNFSAEVENTNIVRVKALNTNDGTVRSTTVTVYLAETQSGEKKATATINVKQAGLSSGPIAITIPELVAKIIPEAAAAVVLDADNDYTFEGVVMNDVAGGNYSFNNLILATEGATEQHNGVTLYGSQVEPSTLNLNKGDKVKVTLIKGLAKIQNYQGMFEITGDRDATWCNVEKLGTATITPVEITAAQLADYQGMAVKINNATTTAAGVWANADDISSHTLTTANGNLTVFCNKGADAFLYQPYAAATGAITGLAAVNKNASQLVPRNMADVAAFNPTVPTITYLDPDALSWGSAEVQAKTIAVKGADIDGNLSYTISGGASSKFTVSISGTTVTVTPVGTNETADNIEETLTIAATGGNSMTATLKQAKKGSSGDKTLEIDFSTYGWGNSDTVPSPLEVGAFTFTFTKGSASNPAKWYDSGTAIRLYPKSSMTLASSTATITKIEYTYAGAKYNNWTTNVGTLDNRIWTGSANSILFTVGSSGEQVRLQKVLITYTE